MNDHITIKVEESPTDTTLNTSLPKKTLPRINLNLKIIEEEPSIDSKKHKKKSKKPKAQTPQKEEKIPTEGVEEKNKKEKKHHHHHHHHHSKNKTGEHTPTFGHDAKRPVRQINQNSLKLEIPSIIPSSPNDNDKKAKKSNKDPESQQPESNQEEKSSEKKKKTTKKEKAPKIKNNDGKIHLQEEINPTTTALMNDKKDLESYSEDIMVGLNVISYLNNKNVPTGNKVFYGGILLIIIASYIMNFWDLTLYASTTCQDDYSPIATYINFAALLVAKLGVFNYITSEINANLQYDLKFPFLIPILTVGVLANFQLPLIVYNYNRCHLRSPLIEMNVAYFIIDSLAGIIVVAFVIAILSLILPVKFNISHNTKKMIKTVVYFLSICTMLTLNVLFIFVTFTQANHLSLTLLTENLLYWTLIISGIVVFILKKKYNLRVFKPLNDEDALDRTHDNIQDHEVQVLVSDPKSSPRLHSASDIFNTPKKINAKKVMPLNFKLESSSTTAALDQTSRVLDETKNDTSKVQSKNDSRANPETSSKDCLQIHIRRKETLPDTAQEIHDESIDFNLPASARGV